jgi:hypothetical protein
MARVLLTNYQCATHSPALAENDPAFIRSDVSRIEGKEAFNAQHPKMPYSSLSARIFATRSIISFEFTF